MIHSPPITAFGGEPIGAGDRVFVTFDNYREAVGRAIVLEVYSVPRPPLRLPDGRELHIPPGGRVIARLDNGQKVDVWHKQISFTHAGRPIAEYDRKHPPAKAQAA